MYPKLSAILKNIFFGTIVSVIMIVLLCSVLELTFRAIYGPIHFGFLPNPDNPSQFVFRRELPWCGVCSPGAYSFPNLKTKEKDEIRVLWVGESSVDGYPSGKSGEWMAAAMLDALLKKMGTLNVVQIKMAQTGGMTTDLVQMADDFQLPISI